MNLNPTHGMLVNCFRRSLFLVFMMLGYVTDTSAIGPSATGDGAFAGCDELRLTDRFAAPPYGVAPKYLIGELLLMVGIENPGSCTHTGAYVAFTLLDESQNVVLTLTKDIGVIDPGEILTDVFFETCAELPPDIENGTYTGEYRLFSDFPGLDPGLTTRTFSFMINDVIGMDVPGEPLLPFDFGVSNFAKFNLGVHYYLPDPEGLEVCCMQVGIANAPEVAAIGGDLLVYIFSWEDFNGDGIPQINELFRLAFNQFFFEPDDPESHVFHIELLDEYDPNFTPCVTLQSGDHHIIAVVESVPPFSNPDVFPVVLAQDGGAANYAHVLEAYLDLVNAGGAPPCVLPGNPELFEVYDMNEFIFFSSSGQTPVIRLGISECVDLGLTSTSPQFQPSGELLLYPNPVSHLLEVALPGYKLGGGYDVQVVDTQGRAVAPGIFRLAENRWSLDVSGLTAGMYFLSVRSDAGVHTGRFVVTQ